MLDLVKFTWRNGHGYWIPVAWMTVPSDATDVRRDYPSTTASLREYASGGRGVMTDFKVLDRCTIPEEIRSTGRTGVAKARVGYRASSDRLTCEEYVQAMRDELA